MELSIIVVNYKTYELTKQTIDSVLRQNANFEYEIILVDNSSQDGSIEKIQSDFQNIINQGTLKVIINDSNLGFSKANNIGIRNSIGEYILLLNSDTKLDQDCLQKCIEYINRYNLENPNKKDIIGALGCKIILPDGKLDHACKRGFPTPSASLHYLLGLDKKNPAKYGQYDALHLDEDEIGEVDALMGAFMLMPKSVLNEIGLLDETFFMYGEDIDLCYRIKEAGYKIIYYPETKIIHYKGGSSTEKSKPKRRNPKTIYDFHDAMWIFYKKHYIKKYNVGITILVFLGIWTKYTISCIKNRFI